MAEQEGSPPEPQGLRWFSLPNEVHLSVKESPFGAFIAAVTPGEIQGVDLWMKQGTDAAFIHWGESADLDEAAEMTANYFALLEPVESIGTSGLDSWPFGFDYKSDEDGELHLISDDPASAEAWVSVVRHDRSGREQRRRTKGGGHPVAFPGLNYQSPLSAWEVGRDYCYLECELVDGSVAVMGSCSHKGTEA